MAISNIKTVMRCDVQKVWEAVTTVEDYVKWRSDLSKSETINEKQFIEYDKNDYPTEFTVTVSVPLRRWEFDISNSNMKGHWVGIFSAKDGGTEIDFTEYVEVKKCIMRPFAKSFLKKQQVRFLADLKKFLLGKI